MIDTVVGVVGGRVAVEIGRLPHVPVCVGQAEEVDVVGYCVWSSLPVELTGELSDGWMKEWV